MDNKRVKNHIYKARLRKGLSQTAVACKMHISQTAYQKLEKGKTILVSKRVSEIASVLDLSEEEIILGYNPEMENNRRQLEEEGAKYESIIEEKDKIIEQLTNTLKDKCEIIRLQGEQLSEIRKKLVSE